MSEARAKAAESFLQWASQVVTTSLEKVREIDQQSWDGITRDGTLAAAFRQGVDELGVALKPFPESIQTQEPGSIWNPLHGDLYNAKQGQELTPGDIARDNTPYQPEQSQSQDRSR